MAKNFVQDGNVIDYTAATGISSGDLVLIGTTLAVAVTDIPAGATGALAVEGVYRLPKAAVAIQAGEKLVWDASTGYLTNSEHATAAGDLIGGALAVKPAAPGDSHVVAKIRPNNAELVG